MRYFDIYEEISVGATYQTKYEEVNIGVYTVPPAEVSQLTCAWKQEHHRYSA